MKYFEYEQSILEFPNLIFPSEKTRARTFFNLYGLSKNRTWSLSFKKSIHFFLHFDEIKAKILNKKKSSWRPFERQKFTKLGSQFHRLDSSNIRYITGEISQLKSHCFVGIFVKKAWEKLLVLDCSRFHLKWSNFSNHFKCKPENISVHKKIHYKQSSAYMCYRT